MVVKIHYRTEVNAIPHSVTICRCLSPPKGLKSATSQPVGSQRTIGHNILLTSTPNTIQRAKTQSYKCPARAASPTVKPITTMDYMCLVYVWV